MKHHSYSADRPITKPAEDQLKRGPFAKRLALDLAVWNGDDSLVVALYGEWGMGKTSVKNLVLNDLRKEKHRPQILEFNPWQLSGSGGISEAFFTDLRITLGKQAAGDRAKAVQVQERLDRYAKRLAVGGHLVQAISVLLASLGYTEGAMAALAASGTLNQARDAARTGSESASPTPEEPLHHLKLELNESLKELDQPLLIVIDDIDRLTTREILDIFQLVKVNADFSNVVYLLLCERSVVCAALDEVSNNRGREFLEKIVQVGYHIPRPSLRSVQNPLFAGIDAILGRRGVMKRWDQDRWSRIYLEALQPFFQNLRHVHRFLSSLDFHIRGFHQKRFFEVNPIDLIALEVARVFEPNLFERLAVMKEVLTRDTGGALFAEIKQEEADKAVETLVALASENHRDTMRKWVAFLFPPTSSRFSGEHGVDGSSRQEWLRDARVCHPNLFDRYFAFAPADNELPQIELDRLVEETGDRAKFVSRMESLKKRGLMRLAFESLDAYKTSIPLGNVGTLIEALSDLSDDLPKKGLGITEGETRMMVVRFIYFGLRSERDHTKRRDIVIESFRLSKGTLLAVFFTALEERRKSDRAESDYLIAEPDWHQLQDLALSKIRLASQNGLLRRHPEADYILWRWHDWATDEVRNWVSAQVQNVDGCLWLLSTLLYESRAYGHTLKITPYIQLRHLERFADIVVVENVVAQVVESMLPERQKTAVREFRKAVKRRKDGRPEGDGPPEDYGFGDDDGDE